MPPGALRLGRVLDDHRTDPLGDRPDPLHRRDLAIEVHREHRAGAWADHRVDRVHVDQAGVLVAVDQHGGGAGPGDRLGGGHEGVGR